MSDNTEHRLIQTVKLVTGDWRTDCSCGAHWTQAGSRSPEYLQSIFDSHVVYAKRTATKVD